MTEQEIKQRVREFLSRYLRQHELRDDEDIFGTGFVNSLFAMQLVMFVEKEFGIAVESDDLDLENFRSVDAITGLVCRKQGSAAAS
jgi:acyl carrier protein